MWLTRCPQYLTSALRQAAGISCLDRHTTYISTFSTKHDDEDDGYLFFCKKTNDIIMILFHGPTLFFYGSSWVFHCSRSVFMIPGGFSTVPCPRFMVPGGFSFFSRFQAVFHCSRWAFMVIHGSRLVPLCFFFTVPCRIFMVPGCFHGYSWFQVGFSWLQVGFYGFSGF